MTTDALRSTAASEGGALALIAPLVRVMLGGVLVYAGVLKVNGAWQFAEEIANYRLLPAQGSQILAVTLPWMEIVVGMLLLLGLKTRAAGIGALILFSVFAAAVLSALVRGLDIACGCFGTSDAAKLGLQTLALDAAGIAGALLLLFARPKS
jgi:putative oxidoreductase